MMKTKIFPLLAALLLMAATPVLAGQITASYLYHLSDLDGVKRLSAAPLSMDHQKNEIYAMAGEAVYVFNSNGMQVFSFDYDSSLGLVNDLVATKTGLIILFRKDSQMRIMRCSFRAEPLEGIELKGIQAEFTDFVPNRLVSRGNRIFLVSYAAMQVVEIDERGAFVKGHDLAKMVGFTNKMRRESGLGGFALDNDGSFIFSIPTLAKVFRTSPDGKVDSFGRWGGAAGKFGVIAGVAVDSSGRIFVADKLRNAVMIFGRDFELVLELGAGGALAGPGEVAVGLDGKVYISQFRNQGISVYKLTAP